MNWTTPLRRSPRLAVAAVLGVAAVGTAAALAVQHTQGYALPDPHLTPGATLAVTLPRLCMPGYTATVRQALTSTERAHVDAAYHWTYQPGAQEYDHLISLEIGGANGVLNIWPEPIAQARIKDKLENRLHALVCNKQLTLSAAQQCIAHDWVTCQRRYP